jgi:tetratricopeptide (TPR) repeat protein
MDLQGIECFDILSLEGKALASQLKSDSNLVLLIGSAVSEWHPSNIPSGGRTTWEIASLLASKYPDSSMHDKIAEYISRAPFEYILDRCPDPLTMRSILQDVYNSSAPNSAHEAIANLVRGGFIHSVLTSNYDLCLEMILPDDAPLRHVVVEPDRLGLDADSRILFKIHGSADPVRSTSMVLTLSQEGVLPIWKQEVLFHCLRGRTLLVMGFSGLDFEISPYILKAGPGKVIWNSFRNPCEPLLNAHSNRRPALSPNALRIIRSCGAQVIFGDLRHLLAELDLPFRWENPSTSVPHIGVLFSKRLSNDEISLWSASVLSPPGYARFAEEISKGLLARAAKGTELWARAIFLLGDSQFSGGCYSDSSSNTLKAFREFRDYGLYESAMVSAAKAVDALRCIGRFGKAHAVLEEARRLLVSVPSSEYDRLQAKLDLQEVLLLGERYARAKILYKLGLRRLQNRVRDLRDKACILLKRVCQVSEIHGQWHDLQQCRMWSGRLDIPFSAIYSGDLKPLDDLLGWNHLGHMVPEMMSLRGCLSEGRYNEAPVEKIDDHIQIATEIGCYPEVWKLSLSRLRHYGFSRASAITGWLPAFFHCQYNLPMRVYKLLFEEYR